MNQKDKIIKILSIDDHPLMREGVATIINSQNDMTLIAEAANGREALEKFRKLDPDIALMDLRLPDMSGIDAMIDILGQFPKAKIIILTMFEGDAEVQRALRC